MAGCWYKTMRCGCSGLLVLGKGKTGWGASWSWGHGCTPDAARTAAAATETVLLAFSPPFSQQLLLSIAV